jgi:YbbR domain-containing protein
MMNFLKDLFLRDWLLKLFSLTLAILTWLAVSFSLRRSVDRVAGTENAAERTYYELPVTILSHSGIAPGIQVSPKELDVTVRGEESILKTLSGKSIKVIVDLSELATNAVQRLPVEVITPPGVTQVKIDPDSFVEVTRPTPPRANPNPDTP